uniref:Carboxymethylenebutenolidase homolog n=1 Tax=Anas platyrhynchos platyrhynchos TaxID=8840 RepID=A0A493TSA6_ANAPP
MANESRLFPCDIGDRFDYECCGKEVQVEHIKAYVCKPLASAVKAVIVIQDIFGWQLPNMRYMADMPSAQTFFAGKEAWKPSDPGLMVGWKLEIPEKINKDAYAVLKYLNDQCGVKKLGVIVFCWGGVAAHHMMLTYPKLRAGLIKNSDDVSYLLNPTFLIFAEKMISFPFIKYKLKQNCKVDYQVKIYPGQTHGFEGRKDMINWLDKYI